jgi:hypothetical protein
MASLSEDLLITVNKLQDLVFNTIGNDSLDLPQIVSSYARHANVCQHYSISSLLLIHLLKISVSLGRCRFPVFRKIFCPGKHCWEGFPTEGEWYSHETALDSTAHQHPQ